MLITVTQAMIDEPCVGAQCSDCPVARAVNAVLGEGYSCDATGTLLYILNAISQIVAQLPTPTSATAFIRKFDYKRPVTPFTFELDIPKECL